MKIHEYQARELLADAGIPVPSGCMCTTVETAVEAAESIMASGGTMVVVKAPHLVYLIAVASQIGKIQLLKIIPMPSANL